MKFVKKQSVQESIPQFVLKVLISTVIYFKLSIFQKHHAEERVFKGTRTRIKKDSEKTFVRYRKEQLTAQPIN